MAFVKGTSGNPGGRAKATAKDKAVKKLTKETFNDLSEKMMTCTREELETIINSKVPYEVELFIRNVLAMGEKPDFNQYQKYLDRRIGKVPDDVNLKVTPKPTIIQLSGDRQIVMGSELPEDGDE